MIVIPSVAGMCVGMRRQGWYLSKNSTEYCLQMIMC